MFLCNLLILFYFFLGFGLYLLFFFLWLIVSEQPNLKSGLGNPKDLVEHNSLK